MGSIAAGLDFAATRLGAIMDSRIGHVMENPNGG
jgi:hypothetical protein